MKKHQNHPIRVNSVGELHKLLGLPKPLHPLISIMDNTDMIADPDLLPNSFIFDFYKISFKKSVSGKMGYGQGYYDFDEGGMIFTAPHQLISLEAGDIDMNGFSLIFHSDFIRNYPLGNSIKKYGFFSYETNEALHLSEKEKTTILRIVDTIKEEMNNSIDDFSQEVFISYIELLLNYSNRFYKRQFITRKAINHDLLAQLEQLLEDYFNDEKSLNKGLPTVEFLASQVNLSPRYLSDMLRSLIGKNTQQLIHEKIIDLAKERLLSTNQSVSEIAYSLGFEHPQSFNKLFKAKTKQSPLNFRTNYN